MTIDSDSLLKYLCNESGVKSHDSGLVSSLGTGTPVISLITYLHYSENFKLAMFKSEFRWILFAALYAVFTILVSANEAEQKIVDNYYYENEDDLMRTESFDENFDTNSTEEEDDYDYEDYYSLDLESDLEKLEEGSQEELSGPRSYECGSGPSKILDLLDKGVIDPLQLAMDDLLDYANETEILDCIHIMENMTVFKELISVLPDKVLGAIASRPGLFEKLSDDAIVAFAEDENAVAAVDVDTLLEVANGRPHTIGERVIIYLRNAIIISLSNFD